jgi:tetratricopeptide (TPR) repeat protein
MADEQIIHPQAVRRRQHERAVREIVAKGSYSVIFVVLALLAIRPLMVKQLLSRADAYSAFGLYDESKRQCDKVLLLDSENSQAWYNLARIHKARGDRDMAYGAYQKAAETDAHNHLAHFELALLYVEDDQHQQAIPHFDQVRRLRSSKTRERQPHEFNYHRAALDMLLTCYETVGDSAKAQFTREESRVFYPHQAPSVSHGIAGESQAGQ